MILHVASDDPADRYSRYFAQDMFKASTAQDLFQGFTSCVFFTQQQTMRQRNKLEHSTSIFVPRPWLPPKSLSKLVTTDKSCWKIFLFFVLQNCSLCTNLGSSSFFYTCFGPLPNYDSLVYKGKSFTKRSIVECVCLLSSTHTWTYHKNFDGRKICSRRFRQGLSLRKYFNICRKHVCTIKTFANNLQLVLCFCRLFSQCKVTNLECYKQAQLLEKTLSLQGCITLLKANTQRRCFSFFPQDISWWKKQVKSS